MKLITELPVWLSVFCLAVAALLSWLLYSKNIFAGTEKEQRPWWVWLLAGLRFLSIFILCFLLLNPLIKLFKRHVEKPILVFAVDNSESVTANKDSAFYRQVFPGQLMKLAEELKEDYEVNVLAFGHGLKEQTAFDFSEKQSHLSGVFRELYNRYDQQNLGAVILASDGIYNEGSNPLPESEKLRAPVFSIALGDTNEQRDLRITNVRHNQLAFLGNSFPLLLELEALHCRAEKSVLSVNKNGKVLFRKVISPTTERFYSAEPLQLNADEKGVQHYTVNLSPLDKEITYSNNRFDVFIDVIDGKQKILLLALSPHPDVAAIKASLEQNRNYEVQLHYANAPLTLNTEPFSLAILHQLPGNNTFATVVMEQLRNRHTPLLYVLGTQSNIGAFNSLGAGYQLNGFRGSYSDATASVNKLFSLFTLDEQMAGSMSQFPPLKVPFATYSGKTENEVLLKQQIGSVGTDVPLIGFSKNTDSKTGIIFGEGLWRWRLADFQLNGTHDHFNQLLSKMVQYLALKDDKSNFRVHTDKKRFLENEKLVFEAELYNKSYELVNDAEVQMSIKNSEGKTYRYAFSRNNKSYLLNAGSFSPGTYTYTATANMGGKTESSKGSFTVLPLLVELVETRADHQLMQNIASQHNGAFYLPSQLDALKKRILEDESIKPVVYREEEVMDAVNLKWIGLFLFLLLALEWFIRKRNGAY